MGNIHFKETVELTLKVIGGKWKPVILCHLTEGTHRFGELKREMPQITQKMLTQQLRELEEDSVIERKIYVQVPPKVEYSLTEYGLTVKQLLNVLSEWGDNHLSMMSNYEKNE